MVNINTYMQEGVAMTCRSFEEYVRMFSIEQEVLRKGRILDVAAGASSFAAGASERGLHTMAVDPLYELNPDVIASRGKQEIEISTSKLSKLQDQFDWSYYGNIKNHRFLRGASLQRFVNDYRLMGSSRYVAGKLPELPFPDESFDLVLCSHFLFLYGDQFDYTFHKQAIEELLRVCRKGGNVRVYPLYTLGFQPYPKMEELIDGLVSMGVEVNYQRSKLPFIPGSFDLLSLRKI